MNLLAKIGLCGLLAGATASALYADPVGGWLSPNGMRGGRSPAGAASLAGTASPTGTASGAAPSGGAGAMMALSPADLQVRVRQLREQTRADARHIQHLQQVARKEKDIIKLNCVNDKLVQVKPQMNIADKARDELAVLDEPADAKHADRMAIFEAIAEATENVRRLREEADQCIGEPIVKGGESSNMFTGPHAPDDPTKGFDDGPLEPPVYASPFS